METRPIVLVKIGGSLITDKKRDETPLPKVLARLAAEVARARPAMEEDLVLGHGSGSFGHAAAAKHHLIEGLRHPRARPGVPITQAVAARLHRLVAEALTKAGAEPFSLAPSSFLVTRYGRPREIEIAPLLAAVAAGFTPVVYGDVVMDLDQGVAIASTEAVLLGIASRLLRKRRRVSRALWVGATPGLYGPDGGFLPTLSHADWRLLRGQVSGAAGTDVTGGIRLRLDTCFALARLGIPSQLIDGREEGNLERALRGEEVPGTVVPAGR